MLLLHENLRKRNQLEVTPILFIQDLGVVVHPQPIVSSVENMFSRDYFFVEFDYIAIMKFASDASEFDASAERKLDINADGYRSFI